MAAATTPDKLRRLEPGQLTERLRILEGDGPPAALLERLVADEQLTAAVRFLAYALPEREAVWWACACVAHTGGAEVTADERRALDAAEAWVRHPGERMAQEAAWAAADAGPGKPGAWPALAAFWSAASASLDGQAGAGVETAVVRAADRGGDAARRPERLRRFIESGRDIAAGGAGRLPPEAADAGESRP